MHSARTVARRCTCGPQSVRTTVQRQRPRSTQPDLCLSIGTSTPTDALLRVFGSSSHASRDSFRTQPANGRRRSWRTRVLHTRIPLVPDVVRQWRDKHPDQTIPGSSVRLTSLRQRSARTVERVEVRAARSRRAARSPVQSEALVDDPAIQSPASWTRDAGSSSCQNRWRVR